MPLLFKDYTDLVIKAYEKEWAAGELTPLLIQPTTVNIKQECVNVYRERLEKGERVEAHTLQGFFRILPDGINFIDVIDSCSPDRFRPLQSLMRREVASPKLVNVELLAWLIDFRPRPFSKAQQELANLTEAEEQIVDAGPDLIEPAFDPPIDTEMATGTNDADPEIPVGASATGGHNNRNEDIKDKDLSKENTEKKPAKSRLKKAAWASLIAATLLGGTYVMRRPISPDADSAKNLAQNKCKALTKSGEPCKRKANSTGYCWQHD